jgi:formylglycine-generating enzyme required for sulfatase activity
MCLAILLFPGCDIGKEETAQPLQSREDPAGQLETAPPAPEKPFMEMVLVNGGCYGMGNEKSFGFFNERPVHEVCLGDFYIGKYEVTQKQWEEVMGYNPSDQEGCPDCPVTNISWNTIQKYLKKLNEKTGDNYRLPTEAEWEYAGRDGGRRARFSGTIGRDEISDYAWWKNNSNGIMHPVGQKKSNALGLHDMIGNAYEFCSDWYRGRYYEESVRDNPQGPDSSPFHQRVTRGGTMTIDYRYLSVYKRQGLEQDKEGGFYGFRLAKTP